ncbi:hypothetical protein [Novosphingobium sp. CECT 9465]|uniref:hypothetical protein n=1 Tax=Novosphingobium sp. CECT 9465 TaxID=2829794 RepID=UPI001E57E198|nr:hypothetical protein [Novosphingobium sp. CECT 9465]CAH0496454.1 hypothetical protein NVSP9465_01488 [Novosphingobium sp. CECT 9465]
MLTLALLFAQTLPYLPVASSSPEVTAQVTFGCDAGPGHSCGFAIFSANQARFALRLDGGQRAVVRVSPNVDRYVVVIDEPTPLRADACPALVAKGKFCKVAVVSAGYNN